MHGWIRRANLLPFVETLADSVRCQFDESELAAGVEGSDADNDRWFSFVLGGQPRVEMYFAGPDDRVLVDVELDGANEAFEVKAALLLNICSRYRLTPGVN